MYVADQGQHRIRKVTPSGVISSFVGTGRADVLGENVPATASAFPQPYGVAFDAAGNAYIADSVNHYIRKVDTDGNTTTIAGTGTAGYSGDGGLAINAALNEPRQTILTAPETC